MDHFVTTSVGVTQRNVVLEAWSEESYQHHLLWGIRGLLLLTGQIRRINMLVNTHQKCVNVCCIIPFDDDA